MSPGATQKAKRARRAVQSAIAAGKLRRQPCDVCGETDLVDAHHEDYDKPLDVRWLCHGHHAQLHALRRPQQPRLTDTPLSYNGETLSIADLAVRRRMCPSTLYQRIAHLGWHVELALSLRPASPRLVGRISCLVRSAQQCLIWLRKERKQRARKPALMEIVEDSAGQPSRLPPLGLAEPAQAFVFHARSDQRLPKP